MTKKKLSYKEALNRIQEIVSAIESNQVDDIDQLTSMVKEATSLISSCKDKLQNAEVELQSSLDKLN